MQHDATNRRPRYGGNFVNVFGKTFCNLTSLKSSKATIWEFYIVWTWKQGLNNGKERENLKIKCLLPPLQIVNFDSDELFEELNQSAESESEEERNRRHIFREGHYSGQDRKRRRRRKNNSHFLVGEDKVSFGSATCVVHLPLGEKILLTSKWEIFRLPIGREGSYIQGGPYVCWKGFVDSKLEYSAHQ